MMRGLSQILMVKGVEYTADPEYDKHLSDVLARAKHRVKELREQGWLAVYRKVSHTGGTEEGYQVFRRSRQ